jgi:hypothetical protein
VQCLYTRACSPVNAYYLPFVVPLSLHGEKYSSKFAYTNDYTWSLYFLFIVNPGAFNVRQSALRTFIISREGLSDLTLDAAAEGTAFGVRTGTRRNP